MKCLSIGTSGFLAHNDKLAGFFTNESLKANGAIHLVEQRKLSKEETDKFLKDVDAVEDIDTEPTSEDYGILNNIARYYPEMRYFVHGLKITAAKPSKKKRKQMADELRIKEENRKKADKAKKDKAEKELKTKKAVEPVLEVPQKSAEDKEKAQEQYREALKKQEAEHARKEVVKDAEKKLSDSGKPKGAFTGFKGLLFKMFDRYPDAKTREEQEKIKKELKEEWKKYKVNKEVYDKNQGLVESLETEMNKGTLTPASISLMNELIARDKKWAEYIDFEIEKPTMVIPLTKFANYLKKDNGEITSEQIVEQLGTLFKEENLDGVKYKLDLKSKSVKITTDWHTAMKLLDTFGIKTNDLKKPIS